MTLIEDYIHHGEKQSCQAVEDGYVFVNINGIYAGLKAVIDGEVNKAN